MEANEAERAILNQAAWNLLLGANMLEIAGLDSKDRIEAHKSMMRSHYDVLGILKPRVVEEKA